MINDFIQITVIIPFLNEQENIPRLGTELSRFAEEHKNLGLEVILVNDGSTDHSVSLIKNTAFPIHTKLISLSQNFGSHAALRAGISNASGKYITFMYADLQDPLSLIPDLYKKSEENFDIVWATRRETSSGFFERLFSKQYARLMKAFVNPVFPEKGFDIVMFNNKIKQELNKNIEANSSLFLQILNLGFRQEFIFYEKSARKAGVSKWTLTKKIKLLIDSFVAFSFAPIRFVTYSGLSFFIIGISWTFYIITRKLIFNDLAAGWPMLISILLIGFGITNISLGIIAEYLWRTLDASRKRPVYIVDEITEINTSTNTYKNE